MARSLALPGTVGQGSARLGDVEPGLLPRFFARVTRSAFGDLTLNDARAEAEPDAPLFARLAAGFERYAGALTYIRKVYFRDTPLPWRGLATP